MQTFLELGNNGNVSTYARYAGIILVIIQEEDRASLRLSLGIPREAVLWNECIVNLTAAFCST
jgi:hypothetical protein